MHNDHDLLDAIARTQERWLQDINHPGLFQGLLDALLALTESAFGFIGETQRTDGGQPFLNVRAFTDIAWNETLRSRYSSEHPEGMEFHSLDNLFGAVVTTGALVLSNQPEVDPRRKGLPEGHPAIDSFLGLPLYCNASQVGMVGIANRPGGYSESMAQWLQPFLSTCANLIHAQRLDAQRCRAERQFRDQAARYDALFRHTEDAIVLIGVDGFIDSINPKAEHMFGYQSAELVGRDAAVLLPEPQRGRYQRDIRPLLPKADAAALKAGLAQLGGAREADDVLEISALHRDGRALPLALTISDLPLHEQRLFSIVARDYSQRSREMQTLQQSRDDLMTVFNQLKVGVVLLDAEQHIQFLSEVAAVLLGADSATVLGRHWTELLRLDDASRRALCGALAQPNENQAAIPFGWQTADGQQHWAEIEVRADPHHTNHSLLYIYDETEVRQLHERLQHAHQGSRYGAMIGASLPMRALYEKIERVAPGDWTVLIQGETGVGKELVARAIHAASLRDQGPFVAVNCAGLTESLLTSQLFGHRRGAFTGAVADHQGFFETAKAGTLFLDEIGDVPLATQSVLLRAVEQKEIIRLGDSRPRAVDFRLLLATHLDLEHEVTAGQFREDLFYRIAGTRVAVPPLRDRPEDIPLLVNAFMADCASSPNRPHALRVSALDRLMRYHWPGNVRELKSLVDHLMINCRVRIIEAEHLPQRIRQPTAPAQAVRTQESGDERARLLAALAQARGNRTRAAKLLGIGRATLYRRLNKLGLSRAG